MVHVWVSECMFVMFVWSVADGSANDPIRVLRCGSLTDWQIENISSWIAAPLVASGLVFIQAWTHINLPEVSDRHNGYSYYKKNIELEQVALGLVSMKQLDPAGRQRNYTKKKSFQKAHFGFLTGPFSEQFLKECGEHFNNLNTLFPL